VPIEVKFEIVDGFIKINWFNYKKKIYCYKDNVDCPGILMNPNSFEFISLVENVNLEEAERILKERNSSPFYKENWKSDEDYRKSQSRGLNYYIDKYGDELGEKKYNEHIDKISYSNSIDRYIEEFGEIEGRKVFDSISSSKDSMSYEYFLKKNNNNKKLALYEYNKRLESVNVSVERWINEYGKDLAIKKHKERVKKYDETFSKNPNKDEINKSKGITIENLYNKYGDMEIAQNKYKDWVTKVSVPLSQASKESLSVFLPLIDFLSKNGINKDDIYIGYNGSNEYFIRDSNRIFFYDFTIKSKKIIIEFNGIMFHPKNEKSEWYNPLDKTITTKEAYDRQKYKLDLAKKEGFSVLEIWSDESESQNLDKCIEFIKSKIVL
jgi:very-short-patch-repair endonuclease